MASISLSLCSPISYKLTNIIKYPTSISPLSHCPVPGLIHTFSLSVLYAFKTSHVASFSSSLHKPWCFSLWGPGTILVASYFLMFLFIYLGKYQTVQPGKDQGKSLINNLQILSIILQTTIKKTNFYNLINLTTWHCRDNGCTYSSSSPLYTNPS